MHMLDESVKGETLSEFEEYKPTAELFVNEQEMNISMPMLGVKLGEYYYILLLDTV